MYRIALELYPKRLNSVLGAARAAAAAGGRDVAREFYRDLVAMAAGSARPTVLDEARRFIAQRERP
jgi:hypothetical protein